MGLGAIGCVSQDVGAPAPARELPDVPSVADLERERIRGARHLVDRVAVAAQPGKLGERAGDGAQPLKLAGQPGHVGCLREQALCVRLPATALDEPEAGEGR